MSLLNIAVFSTDLLLTFLLSDSGGPAAVDILDVPFVPAAAVTSDVNSVPAQAGLPACCCCTTFASNPTLASVPTVLAVLLLLLFLLLLAFLLLWVITLLLPSLLLLL